VTIIKIINIDDKFELYYQRELLEKAGYYNIYIRKSFLRAERSFEMTIDEEPDHSTLQSIFLTNPLWGWREIARQLIEGRVPLLILKVFDRYDPVKDIHNIRNDLWLLYP
jgi:hypothetical protein